jgi:hypothetical protein
MDLSFITGVAVAHDVIISLIVIFILAILGYISDIFGFQKKVQLLISLLRISFEELDAPEKLTLITFILFISLSSFIMLTNSNAESNPTYLKDIAPQLENIQCIYISTYAANGNVIHDFITDKIKNEKYIKLNLRNYGKKDDCNCGLIIAGLCGFDAKEFKNLSFYAKGEFGGEKFGVKLKDLSNSESSVSANNYADNKKITKLWTLVDIPLKDFLRVDRQRIECITFYTDGNISGDNLTTIYIKNIEFTD